MRELIPCDTYGRLLKNLEHDGWGTLKCGAVVLRTEAKPLTGELLVWLRGGSASIHKRRLERVIRVTDTTDAVCALCKLRTVVESEITPPTSLPRPRPCLRVWEPWTAFSAFPPGLLSAFFISADKSLTSTFSATPVRLRVSPWTGGWLLPLACGGCSGCSCWLRTLPPFR